MRGVTSVAGPPALALSRLADAEPPDGAQSGARRTLA